MSADLIERLEAASGPDRELDGAIALYLGWTLQKLERNRHPYWRRPGQTEWFERVEAGPPAFTASIDAAMTLVPDDWSEWWHVGRGQTSVYGAQLRRYRDGVDFDAVMGAGQTPAIALAIAALKAREAGR